jgi:hypothetical protein
MISVRRHRECGRRSANTEMAGFGAYGNGPLKVHDNKVIWRRCWLLASQYTGYVDIRRSLSGRLICLGRGRKHRMTLRERPSVMRSADEIPSRNIDLCVEGELADHIAPVSGMRTPLSSKLHPGAVRCSRSPGLLSGAGSNRSYLEPPGAPSETNRSPCDAVLG